METGQNRKSGWRSRVLVLVIGTLFGGGLVAAHFGGLFTPVFHKLGLHFAHQQGDQEPGGKISPGDHAGHGGMPMTQQVGGEPSKLPGYAIVKITPERQQLIGVRTGKVKRGKLDMSIRAVGIIEPDQTRLFRIHTRVSGWITKVHVNFVGKNVKKGDTLVEIYSPDLLQAQLDYLLALDTWEKQGKTDRKNDLWTPDAADWSCGVCPTMSLNNWTRHANRATPSNCVRQSPAVSWNATSRKAATSIRQPTCTALPTFPCSGSKPRFTNTSCPTWN